MAERNYHNEQTDRYLRREMGEEERWLFEQELEKDPLLKEELALDQDIRKGIEVFFSRELKASLQRAEEEIRNKKVTGYCHSRRIFLWASAMAASFLIIILAGYFITSRKPDLQELYLSYYQPYPNIVAPIERSKEGEGETSRAFRLYEKGHYEEAIAVFEKALLTKEEKERAALNFYFALSLLKTGEEEKAIGLLNQLKTEGGNRFTEPSFWYLGLAYLKKRDKNNALQVFEQIAHSSSAYRYKAMEIMDEL